MSNAAPSSYDDLSAEDRRLLVEAHTELRAAIASYEQFLGGQLELGEPASVARGSEIADAQARIGAAEDRLWQLRERLLGWARPSWAPTASLVSDWFSDDDAVYDEVTETARR